MKRFFFIIVVAAFGVSCADNDAPAPKNSAAAANAVEDTANYTTLQWIDSTYQDIGKVKEGQVAEVSWRLKNAGTKPLVIAQVVPGCGCTVADKPEEPIMPGGEGTIRAKFSSAGQHEGEHRKALTVTANTKTTTNYQLQFRAEVVK